MSHVAANLEEEFLESEAPEQLTCSVRDRGATDVVRHGIWGMADQGIVSLGSVLSNLILARALSMADFGAYFLILGVMLFLNNLHASLVTYPLSVLGALETRTGLAKLTSKAATLSLLLIPVHGATALVVAALTNQLGAAPFIVLALFLRQVQETFRRSLMAALRFQEVIWGDTIGYLGQAAILWAYLRCCRPNLSMVFLAMAATSLAALIVQGFQVGVHAAALSELKGAAASFYRLGKWAALSHLAGSFNILAVPWTLRAFHGIAEPARLAATGVVLGVTHPALFGVANLIVPAAARAREQSADQATRAVGVYVALGALLTLPYYAAAALFPGTILKLFYGPMSPYIHLRAALIIFSAVYVLNYFAATSGAILNGLGHPRANFTGQLAGAAVGLALTLPLGAMGGVEWALYGNCFAMAAQLAVNAVALARLKGVGLFSLSPREFAD